MLGASLTVEPTSEDGRRLDFLAKFADSKVHVEATSPSYNARVGEQFKEYNRLLDVIEPLVPPGWSISAERLPHITLDNPTRVFKRTVAEMLEEIGPPTEEAAPVVLSTTEEQEEALEGGIQLLLLPRGYYPDRAVIGEPGVPYFDNTEQRVLKAVRKKRVQARGADSPVLIAINTPHLTRTSSTRQFDMALYGRTGTVGDEHMPTVFEASGEWTQGSYNTTPALAGVLAFLSVERTGGPDPVLYLHPRFDGRLPDAFLQLEQCRFEPSKPGIEVRSASRLAVLHGMEWVDKAALESDD